MAIPLLLAALGSMGLMGWAQNKYRTMLNDEAAAENDRVGGLLQAAQEKAYIYGRPGEDAFSQAYGQNLALNPETAKFGFDMMDRERGGMLQTQLQQLQGTQSMDRQIQQQGFVAGQDLLQQQAQDRRQRDEFAFRERQNAAELDAKRKAEEAAGMAPPKLPTGWYYTEQGTAAPVPGGEDWQKGQAAMDKANMALNAATEYQKALSGPDGAEMWGEGARKQSALRNQLLLSIKDAENLGSLDAGTMEFAEQILADPNAFTASGDKLKQQVEVIANRLRLKAEQNKRQYKAWGVETELRPARSTEGLIPLPANYNYLTGRR
jgi:hypothetical protein